MREVDYDSQEELINELHEALLLDPDGGSKVEHYCIIQQKRQYGLLTIDKLRGVKFLLMSYQPKTHSLCHMLHTTDKMGVW